MWNVLIMGLLGACLLIPANAQDTDLIAPDMEALHSAHAVGLSVDIDLIRTNSDRFYEVKLSVPDCPLSCSSEMRVFYDWIVNAQPSLNSFGAIYCTLDYELNMRQIYANYFYDFEIPFGGEFDLGKLRCHSDHWRGNERASSGINIPLTSSEQAACIFKAIEIFGEDECQLPARELDVSMNVPADRRQAQPDTWDRAALGSPRSRLNCR